MQSLIENLLFRAIVLATLIIVAALFAMSFSRELQFHDEATRVEQPHAHEQASSEAGERVVFGLGAEGWTAVFTGILAFFTMGLAGITFRLFQVTRNGIFEQGEMTRASTQVAERALTGLDRPYIFPVIFSHNVPTGAIFGTFRSENTICIEFAYRNFGKTPAILKSFGFLPMVRERGTPRRSTQEGFVNSEIENAIGTYVLGDGQLTQTLRSVLSKSPHEDEFMARLPPALLEQIRANQAAQANFPVAISLHDRITYADMLGNEYVLSVVFEFTGTAFSLVETEERQTKAHQ